MEIENPLGFEELEEVGFYQDAERSEDAEGGGVGLFQGFDGFKVGFIMSMEEDVDGRGGG